MNDAQHPHLPETYWQDMLLCRQHVLRRLAWSYPDANWQDCEDAVSEAFLRAVPLLPLRDLPTWVLLVSRRILINQWRAQRRLRFLAAGVRQAWPASEARPDIRIHARHDSAYYLLCLRPKARQRLLDTIEAPYNVIAQRWGCTPAALAENTRRARGVLRQARRKEER